MSPEELENKIRDEVNKSGCSNPMLKIFKYNEETKYGRYVQLGDVEGAGRCLFTRTPKKCRISVFPFTEIKDVFGIPKEKNNN